MKVALSHPNSPLLSPSRALPSNGGGGCCESGYGDVGGGSGGRGVRRIRPARRRHHGRGRPGRRPRRPRSPRAPHSSPPHARTPPGPQPLRPRLQPRPLRLPVQRREFSIEGWIILVSGVKEDAEEDDLYNAFCEFGHVKDLHFNLERRTGYAKGYTLVEYESFEEAQTAIKAMNGMQLLTKTIYVDWAFNRGPIQKVMSARPLRRRSRTPPRRLAALTY